MQKKAFTLTELLVVVVIIGVLAAVVLPKFNKVLESRKTTEAEQLMAAVRNEQEARCTLDKNYTADTDKLASWPKNLGTNYNYELTASGISATSDKGYKLAIQSYRDGSICCSGDYCSKLGKSYPECSEEVESTGCEAEDVGPGPEPEPEEGGCDSPTSTTDTTSRVCGCKGTQTGTRTFDTESCSWGEYEWGECVGEETNCCDDSYSEGQPDRSEACGPCGTLNYIWTCQDNTWKSIPSNGCEVPDGFSNECTPGATETNKDGSTRTCSDTCAWGNWISECEHGTRADGTCKQPKYGWKFDSTGSVSIPACPYNNVTNPTQGESMPTSICYDGVCPGGVNDNLGNFLVGNTLTQPAGGRRCGECNEQTGGYACFSSVTTSLKPYAGQDKYNYCNFVVFQCSKNWLIGYE